MLGIRQRLLLWHIAVFTLGLVSFSVVVWWGTREALYRDLDRWLVAQAEGLERFVQNEVQGDQEQEVIDEVREFSIGLPEASGIQVYRSDGTRLFGEASSGRLVERTVNVRGHTYRFTTWRSVAGVEATLRSLSVTLLTLTPIFLLFSLGGGWLLSRKALQPVDDVTAAARTVSLQNLSMRLPVPGQHDELQRLSLAWNEMLGRLEDSTKRLAQFTADASHELRTPVAVVRMAAEIALRHERSNEEYREVLQKIQGQSEDMTATIENLMELARADAGQAHFVLAPVDVGEVLEEVRAQVAPLVAARGLGIALRVADGNLGIAGDRASLLRLLLILVENAMKFTPSPGQIDLDIGCVDSEVVVVVADTGIGIGSEDLPRIFDRFYQADSARAQGGSGLGLSLAQWVAQGHRGRIEVETVLGAGARFRVYLPQLS